MSRHGRSGGTCVYYSIHYCRGLAAMMVVVAHVLNDPRLNGILHAGVDLFFVISGFVIYTATRDRAFSLPQFAWRRFMRIYPTWWVASAVFVFAAAAVWPKGIHPPGDLLKSFLLIPYVNPRGDVAPVIEAGWTLPFELFFYALFAIAMTLGRWWLSLAALAGLFVGGLVLPPASPIIELLTHSLLLEFAMGMLIAHAVHTGWKGSGWLLALGLPLLLLAAQLGPNPPLRGIVKGLPVALIIAGLVAIELRERLPRSGVLHLFGSASYSLYLFHGIALMVCRTNGIESRPVLFVIATAFGLLAWWLVERRILNAARPNRPYRNPA